MKERLLVVGLLASAAILFIANTWGYDLWPPDEPRFAEVAREMMQSGNYLAPTVNNLPYKEKPPLLFWTISAVSWPFGDVNEFTARVPSALGAIITVWLTYLLARRLYGQPVAVWAAVVLMTSIIFWSEARSSRTDMLLTMAMTGALYAFWRWHETKSSWYLIGFYAAVALGMLAKGPPALVFPVLLVVAFYWKQKEDRRRTHYVLGLLAAMVPVLLWFIPARMGLPAESATHATGLGGEMFRQVIGRFFLGVSKAAPPWKYLLDLPVDLFPWSIFLPYTILYVWRRRREDVRMRLLLSWSVPAFIFFSICIGKRDIYLLPIYPVLAIVTARGVLDLAASERIVWRKRTGYVWGLILLLIAIAAYSVKYTEYSEMWSVGMLGFSLAALVFSVITFAASIVTDMRHLHKTTAAQFAALALMIPFLVFPRIDLFKGASGICRPLRELSDAGRDYRLYSIGFAREEYTYYSRHFLTPVLNDILPMQLTHDLDEMTVAKQQYRLRKEIVKAADKIQMSSFDAPSQQDIDAIRNAIHMTVQKVKVDPELAEQFEAAVSSTMSDFEQEFSGSTPAFVFIQEQDWKWLLPIYPALAQLPIIKQEAVGQRDMLLISNEAGARLVGVSAN